MRTTKRRRPGFSIAVMTLGSAIVLTTFVLKFTHNDRVAADEFFPLLLDLAFVLLGAITIWLRSENRMSWLFAWVGIALGLSMLSDEYGTLDFEGQRPALATVAAWLSSWVWVPAFGPLATLMLLWFPDGRPPSLRWRSVERAVIALMTTFPLLLAFAQDPESDYANPLAIPFMTRMLEAAFVVIGPAFPILVALCLWALVIRFRRSRGEQRQQLKWFVLAAGLVLIYMAGDTLVSSLDLNRPGWLTVLEMTAFLSLPIAAGIAILRYRLYDIDVIINRTLVYGVLTAALLGTYLLIVFALSRVLDPVTRDSDIAVAASTLTVAAFFRPLRARIQGFIDRRFYRARYDAGRALHDFGTRLRHQVDIDTLRDDVLTVVGSTLQPRHASLWVRAQGQSR